MDLTPRSRSVAGLIAVVALAALAVLSLWTVQPPAPAGADAPADQFSAARAYAHIEQIGAKVHVAGSPAAGEVRDYIVQTLRAYGLQPQIQELVGADAALGHGYAMAHVRNVVAVLPGQASTGRVFDVAHYDSVQVSYGANDDGAGVSSLLETARAMAQGPRPRNDTVFVFTEAEEACLCGAEAFVNQSAFGAQGGVVLNFESRGSTGPSIMFETSAGNAGVVSVYGDAVPYPVATSFAVEVYRILPNDTDFTPFRESGRFTGLNSAYIDGSATYHSPEDRPSYLDKSSLQQQGANALAMTQAFSDADLATLATPSAGDLTYFPVLGYLVRYPGWLVWPLAGLALAAVAGLGVVAVRRRRTTVARIAAGFGLGLVPLVVAPALTQLLWILLVAIRPGYGEMIDPWRPDWYRAGVVALVATVVLAWYGLLRRRFGAWSLAAGGLAWLAVLGLVLAAATPGGSYLAAVPALAVAAGGIVALSVGRAWVATLALALGGAVAVLVLAPTVLLFFPALGLATGLAAALFATLMGLALLPALDALYPPRPVADEPLAGHADTDAVEGAPAAARRGTRRGAAWPALVTGVLTITFVAAGLAVDPFDAVHPAPQQLMYALDTDTGQARWVSADDNPGSWNGTYLSGHENLGAQFPPLGDRTRLTGPATAASLPAPALTVTSDTTADARRTLAFTVRPQRSVRMVYVGLTGATVVKATVDGREVPSGALGRGFGVLFHAPAADGLPITLVLEEASAVKLRVMDGSDGLDQLPGFTPRPSGIGVAGSHDSELVLVARTYPV